MAINTYTKRFTLISSVVYALHVFISQNVLLALAVLCHQNLLLLLCGWLTGWSPDIRFH